MMDVPSWHPANQNADALRRLATSGGAVPQRTEFKEVGTSTEEEREQVDNHESAALGGGRGLLDPSDRLYLLEQTRLEQQATSREKMERDAALQTFRSNALKLQAHKAPVLGIAVTTVAGGKPSRSSTEKKAEVVVVKAKKRRAAPDKEAKVKRTKKAPKKAGYRVRGTGGDQSQSIETMDGSKKTKAVPSNSPVTTLLLQDYSRSSDEE